MKICIIKAAKFIINKSFIIESVKECSSEMFIHIKSCLKKGSYTVFFKKKKEREGRMKRVSFGFLGQI